MRKILFIISLFFTVLYSSELKAQRLHSSQSYSIPLLLNPAQTGNSNYDFRAGINYRNQWNSVKSPFTSSLFYVDAKLSPQLLPKSWLGVGGMVFSDKAGDGGLKTTQIMFTSAINKSISDDNTMFLSLGFGVQTVNRSIDFSKLTFGNQLDDRGNNNRPSMENFKSQSLFYMDFSLGTQLIYFQGKTRYHFGLSTANINSPKESFYEIATSSTAVKDEVSQSVISENKRNLRWSLSAGVDYILTEKTRVYPEFIYTTENSMSELILGANFETIFGNDSNMAFYGLWYRFSGDIIPSIGYRKTNFRLICTYDINVSDLQVATGKQGGFEISLSYLFGYSNPRNIRNNMQPSVFRPTNGSAVSCPKFSHEDDL